MAREGGPYLSFAALCERVLEEKDGVLTLVRVIDRINFDVQGTGPIGAELPVIVPPPLPLTLALSFKSGAFRGSLDLKVRVLTPSGFKWPEFSTSILFEGDDDRGANVLLPMRFPAQEDGLHWFVVELGGEVATRVPIRVVKRTSTQLSPPQL